MRLGGNLFIKIFVGFWLATITILISWMLSTHYFDTRHGDDQARGPDQLSHHTRPPPRFMLRALYSLQHLPEIELRSMIDELRSRHRVQVFLLLADDSELYGRDVPADVKRMAARLTNENRRAMTTMRGKRLLGHLIYRDGRGQIRAVFVLPRPTQGLLRALGENLWLRIALAVLISGLVCYLLSKLMTRRLKELGRASRRLADGDLDTRLAVRRRGGDETDELARDFNTMAAQLQARVNAQKRLLSDVSHELRSPLARLRVALALAEDDAENLPSHLARIGRETVRLDALIDQLLSTDVTPAQMDTHIDLVALLNHLCADVGFEGKSQAIATRFDTPLDEAVIASTSDLLHKCFENVLRNALHHSPKGGTILVALLEDQSRYIVTIEDQGPGVPPQHLETIFNEFHRVDSARTREAGGYGLGLAIARRAVQRHGGEIYAENCDPGLRITISIPRERP